MRGIIRLYREVNNKEVTQWISTRGNFVTDIASFIFQSVGRWNIVALTDRELYTIDRKKYNYVRLICLKDWHKA